jgi:hypothetical protein
MTADVTADVTDVIGQFHSFAASLAPRFAVPSPHLPEQVRPSHPE